MKRQQQRERDHGKILTWPGLWKSNNRGWIDEMEPEYKVYIEPLNGVHPDMSKGAYNAKCKARERRDCEILDALPPDEFRRVSKMSDEDFAFIV